MDIRGAKLHPDMMFHIFNRGINGAKVFFEEKNYHYFLHQYARYVHPYVETFAYCLLGNHFHILIRVRSEEQLASIIPKKGEIQNKKEKPVYWHVSNAFSSFLQSYTRAMNKMYERTGSLFESPFKRIAVTDEAYFSRLVTYIHHNPVKHGLTDDYTDYPYSSYYAYRELKKNTKLSKGEVLEWFGGGQAFEDYHRTQHKEIEALNKNLLIE